MNERMSVAPVLAGAADACVHDAMAETAAAAPHALAGTWSGTGKAGNEVEVHVEDDGGGRWCYWFSNKGMKTNAIKDPTISERQIAWHIAGTRTTLTLTGDDGNRAVFQADERGVARNLTTMHRARYVRCLDRFRPEGGPVTVPERGPDTAPIIGRWTGNWRNGSSKVGVIIARIDSRGRAYGRYCSRWRGKHNHGTLTLFDMDPRGGFLATASPNGHGHDDHSMGRRHRTDDLRGQGQDNDPNIKAHYQGEAKTRATAMLGRVHDPVGACSAPRRSRHSGNARCATTPTEETFAKAEKAAYPFSVRTAGHAANVTGNIVRPSIIRIGRHTGWRIDRGHTHDTASLKINGDRNGKPASGCNEVARLSTKGRGIRRLMIKTATGVTRVQGVGTATSIRTCNGTDPGEPRTGQTGLADVLGTHRHTTERRALTVANGTWTKIDRHMIGERRTRPKHGGNRPDRHRQGCHPASHRQVQAGSGRWTGPRRAHPPHTQQLQPGRRESDNGRTTSAWQSPAGTNSVPRLRQRSRVRASPPCATRTTPLPQIHPARDTARKCRHSPSTGRGTARQRHQAGTSRFGRTTTHRDTGSRVRARATLSTAHFDSWVQNEQEAGQSTTYEVVRRHAEEPAFIEAEPAFIEAEPADGPPYFPRYCRGGALSGQNSLNQTLMLVLPRKHASR